MDTLPLPHMTPDEALTWKAQVGTLAHALRALLWDGYQRQVWLALGYPHWTACLQALAEEYGFTERRLWQLHAANTTERQLNHGSVGQVAERVLRPLTRLEPEAQRAAWQEAVATAPGGKVTAAHVQATVTAYQQQAVPPAAPPAPPPAPAVPTDPDALACPLYALFRQWQRETHEQLWDGEVLALVEQLEDSDHDSYVQWVSALLELATRLDDGETLDDRETTLTTLVGETLGLEGVDECDTDSLRELATRLQAFRPEAWEGRFVPEEADRAALAQGWTRRHREHEIDCAGLLWSYAESGWTVTAIAEATGLSLASVEEWLRYARFLIFLGERATGTTFDPERAALAPEDTTD